MSIHKNYLELGPMERKIVDESFDKMAQFITKNTTIKLNWADDAEKVVEAIATWVIERKDRHYI